MRSSDLILGIAYDIPAFTMFQEMLALELGVPTGTYTHISNSLHIYERHFSQVERILRDPWVKEFPGRAQPMPVLPEKPPIEILMAFESSFRLAGTDTELTSDVNTMMAQDLNQYWKDWLLILAWHRAGKLDLGELQTKLMSQVSFSGYKLFIK